MDRAGDGEGRVRRGGARGGARDGAGGEGFGGGVRRGDARVQRASVSRRRRRARAVPGDRENHERVAVRGGQSAGFLFRRGLSRERERVFVQVAERRGVSTRRRAERRRERLAGGECGDL